MKSPRTLRRLIDLSMLLAVVVCVGVPRTALADEPGYNAATYLLKQATQPYRDGRHNVLLRGLRQLADPDLKPMYTALTASTHAPQRVHGMLGLAEISPAKRLDLAALAEVKDERELVEILSAAMDDDLIDKPGMASLMSWDGLALPVRQAVALRLLGEGGAIDARAFAESIGLELSEAMPPGQMLQYALGGLVLAESGAADGVAALEALGKLRGQTAEAVLAQVIDGAKRRELKAGGPLALTIASDRGLPTSLRLLAVQAALRLEANGASAQWQAMYQEESEPARRIRLALIALDSAAQADPSVFQTLSQSEVELCRLIGQAATAVQRRADPAAVPGAFAPLIAAGQPLSAQWVVTYCRRDKPAFGPSLLEQVIRHHASGASHHRARLAESAIAATQTLCEVYPEAANRLLPGLLEPSQQADDPDATATNKLDLQRRQIVLLGITRSRSAALKPLAESIRPDTLNDFTTGALRLLIRARYNAPLDKAEWTRISDLVQGVGQMDLGLRVQLAWLYLEHLGRGGQAIKAALQ